MNIVSILFFVISGYLIPETLTATSVTPTAQYSRCIQGVQRYLQEGGHRAVTQDGIKKYCHNVAITDRNGEYPWSKNTFFKRQSSDGDDGASEGDSSSDGSNSTMTTLKGLLKRIPQTNFYSSIPNAIGVIGQGFSVLEKVSIALGTPLPYWIGSLPIVVFGIALMFIPDLTTLNLPGFYPSGAGENDPLAAFPPFPDLDGLPDVDLSLSADNIPPRIIPPGAAASSEDGISPPASQVSIASDDGNDDDAGKDATLESQDFNPTNPESFFAPRRRSQVKTQMPAYVNHRPPPQQFQKFNNHPIIHRPR